MTVRIIAALLVALLTGCGGIGVARALEVEIKRSGSLGYASADSVYWIDNDRVLFIGGKPGVLDRGDDGQTSVKRFLMEWNIANGGVVVLRELGDFNGLCYDRGYVRYNYRKGENPTIFAGLLGQEVDVTTSVLQPGREHIQINRIDCREYDARAVEEKYGAGFRPLREEHGFVGGRRGADGKVQVFYVRKVGGKEEELVVPLSGYVHWSEFAGGYIYGRSEDLFSATKTTGKMWLLSPSGQLKEFAISAGPWFRGSTGYGLTKQGVFMWSHAVANFGNGDAGVYLIQEGKPQRLLKGYPHAFNVSPDGCKIAMSISLEPKPPLGPEMVVANVCGKGI